MKYPQYWYGERAIRAAYSAHCLRMWQTSSKPLTLAQWARVARPAILGYKVPLPARIGATS